ncbi:hypothetical protein A7982_12474 [Minicystis rosea]|nr:hypothetical protein A7982_12474 [Minicystis rosea]
MYTESRSAAPAARCVSCGRERAAPAAVAARAGATFSPCGAPSRVS